MKELLVMRHAKSSWDSLAQTDFERPLNLRGERDAPRMGGFLAERSLLPDLILSSPAERAKQTAELVCDAADYHGDLHFHRGIYHADSETLLELISQLPDSYERVMLVGHNPGFEDLVEDLCGANARMPTAAIAYILLGIASWADAEDGQGTLQWLVTPKVVKGG